MNPNRFLRWLFVLVLAEIGRVALAAPRLPVEDFARDPAVSQMRLSPDGQYEAFLYDYKGHSTLCCGPVGTKNITRFDIGTAVDESRPKDVASFEWISDSRLVLTTTVWGDWYGMLAVNRDCTMYQGISGQEKLRPGHHPVLLSEKDFLSKIKPVIFFEYDPDAAARYGIDCFSVFEMLNNINYASIIVYDNLGNYHDPQLGHLPYGTPIKFNSNSLGTFDKSEQSLYDGKASVLFKAKNIGIINVTTSVDNQSLSTQFIINQDTYCSPLGNDDTGNGTKEYPYKTIKKCLDVTDAGGTIHLSEGTYSERNLNINKNIKILGVSKEDTIIDGNEKGEIFHVTDSNVNVNISNLKIVNGYEQYEPAGAIWNS